MSEKLHILVVEDSDTRFKSIRDALDDNIVKRVKTAPEAQTALTRERFDLVMLDHDLDEAHYEGKPTEEMTGADLTLWMRSQPEGFMEPRAFFIHSHNPVGSAHMWSDLTRAFKDKRVEYSPWGALKTSSLLREMLHDLHSDAPEYRVEDSES